MKPKVVSVKLLEIPNVAPPSEEEFEFLETHYADKGKAEQAGFKPHEKTQDNPLNKPQEVQGTGEKKGLLGWLKGLFGKK